MAESLLSLGARIEIAILIALYAISSTSLLSLGARIEMQRVCVRRLVLWSLLSLGARIEIFPDSHVS